MYGAQAVAFPRVHTQTRLLPAARGVNYGIRFTLPVSPMAEPTPPSPSPPEPRPGARYDVPAEGSLALLALGARGIEAWRAKRAEVARAADAPGTQNAAPDSDA